VAQKSLPILNKVNTSMVWYTTFYMKHYKWLSSQNLYLMYFFNKLFVYLDFLFYELLWVIPYRECLYYSKSTKTFTKLSKVRFFKPLTCYMVSLGSMLIIFNLYYKTSLEAFQKVTSILGRKKGGRSSKLTPFSSLRRTYFRSWKRKFRK
jgi:hypothetical protein